MRYSNILVAAANSEDDKTALEAAANLIDRKGVIRVVVVSRLVAQSVWAGAVGGGIIAADAMSAALGANAEMRHRCIKLAVATAERHGLQFGAGPGGGRIEVLPARETPWTSLLHEAPLADLLVMGDALAQTQGYASGILADALMVTRTPVLIVRGPGPVAGKIAAIAWDGSLSAGRAVKAAMPLLEAAASIVVLQDPYGLSETEMDAGSPEYLRDELARRGVDAVTIVVTSDGAEGPRLLKAAASANVRLMVAGAFGHSRLKETILGGATRTFLKDENGPHLFLAH